MNAKEQSQALNLNRKVVNVLHTLFIQKRDETQMFNRTHFINDTCSQKT